MRFILFLIVSYVLTSPVFAAVEVALRGQQPVLIADVYRQEAVSYIAIEDLLPVVGLTGYWDSVAHTYRIRTSRGWFVLTPASSYLRLGDNFYPMQDKPVFIDGRLRVSETFIQSQLAQLTGQPVFFRNLDPDAAITAEDERGGLEQLFERFFRRAERTRGPAIRAIAIDPGHGGLDPGVIAKNGFNEKNLTFEVAEKLARLLRMRLGIPVYLSRSGDYDVSLEQRLEPASREDVDLWILVHAQSSFSDQVKGIDLFIRENEDSHKEVSGSRLVADEMVRALTAGAFDVRGITSSSRLSLGRGNLPTVQIEIGYLSHQEEFRQLRQEDYQNRLVQALFDGIQQYAILSREKNP